MSERLTFDRTERRVLGTLIEKGFATPEQYPLTLNALVNGCNQKSNRDPEMALEPFEIEGAVRALQGNGFVVARDREGSRTTRYAHRLDEKLNRDRAGLAILAELMLRGPQTTNELKTRIARMGVALDREQVEAMLRDDARSPAPGVELLARRAGERYARWRHRFTPDTEAAAEPAETAVSADGDDAPARPAPTSSSPPSSPSSPPPATDGALADRVAALERRVADLESALDGLRQDRWHDVE